VDPSVLPGRSLVEDEDAAFRVPTEERLAGGEREACSAVLSRLDHEPQHGDQ
jgi:hypothetical protein